MLSTFFPASRVFVLSAFTLLVGLNACVRHDRDATTTTAQTAPLAQPLTPDVTPPVAPAPDPSVVPTGELTQTATPTAPVTTDFNQPGNATTTTTSDLTQASSDRATATIPTPGERAAALPAPTSAEPATLANGYGVKPPRSTDAAANVFQFASADIVGADGQSVAGNVRFFSGSNDGTQAIIQVVATIRNATPGDHGFHIHETGNCSALAAGSAGGHWNPAGMPHGGPSSGDRRHIGDLGNIHVDQSGNGMLTGQMAAMTGSIIDIKQTLIGKAVVLHDKADDLSTQPSGNSGNPIACGVIQATDANGVAH